MFSKRLLLWVVRAEITGLKTCHVLKLLLKQLLLNVPCQRKVIVCLSWENRPLRDLMQNVVLVRCCLEPLHTVLKSEEKEK